MGTRHQGSGALRAISDLRTLSRSFGAKAARSKRTAVRALARADGRGRGLDLGALGELQDVLNFIRAYPDDPAIRREVLALIRSLRGRVTEASADGRDDDYDLVDNSGLPGAAHFYAYHLDTLRELSRAFPGCLDLDWDSFEDSHEAALTDALRLCLTRAETDGLDDGRRGLREWFGLCQSREGRTDLEVVLELLEGAGLSDKVLGHLFDRHDIPVRYDLALPGSGRPEAEAPAGRVHYQRADLVRTRFDLEPVIRRPLPAPRPVPVAEGRALIHVALAALSSRNLEIYPLIHASPRDVLRIPCGRGLEVVLVGVRESYRSALEAIYFFMILKNGVPVAYGPAGVLVGSCEMGINLFPEFRGAEIREIYAQLMRVLRHVLGAECYHLLPYAMGEDNPDALRSGAFWFYRKLGFVAEDPKVQALARAEEARMAAEPGYRSDLPMLRRLSHTHASFDLSAGRCRPIDLAALGVAVSAFVTRRYGGDRRRAERACGTWLLDHLGGRPTDTPAIFGDLAPLLRLLPGLDGWTASEKKSLLAALRAKGGRSEAPAARALGRHPRFGGALRALVATAPVAGVA